MAVRKRVRYFQKIFRCLIICDLFEGTDGSHVAVGRDGFAVTPANFCVPTRSKEKLDKYIYRGVCSVPFVNKTLLKY